MAKTKSTQDIMPVQAVAEVQKAYVSELDTNPKYSLNVDPENKYGMSDIQKEFIKQYIEFKNVNTAAEIVGIDQDKAKEYFVAYSTQQEIRRINLALYHRQFATRLVDLDEIGGYLTCLLTGENVPLGDQLKSSDKLKVVQMLIDLNKMKAEAMSNPSRVMSADIDVQIKNLSLETISALLNQSKKKDIPEIEVNESLTPEEAAYLQTLPTSDLLDLIETSTNGEST